MADEDGYIAFYDTKSPICGGPNMLWRAHNNAIFDIAWTGDDKQIVNYFHNLTLDNYIWRSFFHCLGC